MNSFIYTNHKTNEVHTIVAHGILEADEKYLAETGNNPIKCPYIGCEIK